MVDREKLKNTTLGESLLRDTFPLRVEIRFCSGENATVLGPQFSWEAGPIVLPQLILGELEGIRVIDEGLIEESDDRGHPDDDDERRRYYTVTTLGRSVMHAEARRLEALVGEARRKHVLGRSSKA